VTITSLNAALKSIIYSKLDQNKELKIELLVILQLIFPLAYERNKLLLEGLAIISYLWPMHITSGNHYKAKIAGPQRENISGEDILGEGE